MKKFDKSKEEKIVNLYKSGYTQKEIAEMFDTYNTSIRRVLLRNNIVVKGNDKQQRLCKHNPFKKRDEWSEYYIGLLLTDGNIDYSSGRNRIRLSLNEEDGYLIEGFLKKAAPKAAVTKTLQKINNSYMWSASITNSEALEYLERIANFHNKSFEAKLYIPLTYHLLRGIVDGDGGYYQQNAGIKLQICGKSPVLLEQIKYFLEKEGFSTTLYTTKRGLHELKVVKVEDVIKLGEKLYQNASICCKRKYLKWLAFYESRRANTLNSGKEMALQS